MKNRCLAVLTFRGSRHVYHHHVIVVVELLNSRVRPLHRTIMAVTDYGYLRIFRRRLLFSLVVVRGCSRGRASLLLDFLPELLLPSIREIVQATYFLSSIPSLPSAYLRISLGSPLITVSRTWYSWTPVLGVERGWLSETVAGGEGTVDGL